MVFVTLVVGEIRAPRFVRWDGPTHELMDNVLRGYSGVKITATALQRPTTVALILFSSGTKPSQSAYGKLTS